MAEASNEVERPRRSGGHWSGEGNGQGKREMRCGTKREVEEGESLRQQRHATTHMCEEPQKQENEGGNDVERVEKGREGLGEA